MMANVDSMSVATLKAVLHDGGEIALLDAREEVPFDARHLLMASCVPTGRIEIAVGELVPRRSVRVLWCDDGEELAREAAQRMLALGYTNVSVLDGGISAWEAAGHPIYSGVHVPSKAFAEVVEHETSTPWIDAAELKQLIDNKADICILDTRSYAEYHSNSIPGAISVPGAEIVYRFKDLVPSADTLVIVNCGGRTRSIVGAQSLINGGVANKVVSLKNGTQDWHLYGYEVLKGATRVAPQVSAEGLASAKVSAQRVAELCKVASISNETLARWRSEADTRTLYLLDVRTLEEYEAGHVDGVKHIAGGQLIQETDRHMAVWGARVVLFDDNGVRATMTASWLRQMGWDVAIISNEAAGGATCTGSFQPRVLGLDNTRSKQISAQNLKIRLDDGTAIVVDLNWSQGFYEGHIPTAWYAIRSRLDQDLANLPSAECLVFTSPDGVLAAIAAADRAARDNSVLALSGGTRAWTDAGFALEVGRQNMASKAIDIRLKAREQADDIEAAMRAYLAWEIQLVDDMAADPDHRFNVAIPSAAGR